MKFEEGWYLLNSHLGFKKIPFDRLYDKKHQEFVRSRKHQGDHARHHLEAVFSDRYNIRNYHQPIRPERSRDIPIGKLPVCERCGRIDNLEREHIIPLSVFLAVLMLWW